MEKNNNQSKGKVIGIDASNLLRGGGVTHLVELLSAIKPEIHNINKVVIWANENTLDLINDQPWLIKATPKEINSGFIYRLYWQKYKLSKAAEEAGCDLILAPGGSFFCKFRPIVTMSRNMLPFEWTEAKRYGFSWVTLRLMMLRYLQLKSFRNASGVIFLTKYAENRIIKLTGNLLGITTIIPHGLNTRFQIKPKEQKNISKYNFDKPFRIIYVSIIDQYKHQWNVVEAVANLRSRGYPVCLSLVGPSYPTSLNEDSEPDALVPEKLLIDLIQIMIG